MRQMQLHYPIPLLKRMFRVSSSGYYAWQDRPLSPRDREELRLELEIKAAHKRTRESYGAERLQHELAENGIRVGVCRIKRIMRNLGLRCRQKRKLKATTYSGHNMPVVDNILDQQFEVSEPNKVWVSDITYIPTDEGWLYLVGHKDLFHGEIVGYAMGERMSRNLVSQSLFRAGKRPSARLRGCCTTQTAAVSIAPMSIGISLISSVLRYR
jgi:putative transposase